MGDTFGDDMMAAARIDRLVHHCHLVTIRGNSYRMGDSTPSSGRRYMPRRTLNRPLVPRVHQAHKVAGVVGNVTKAKIEAAFVDELRLLQPSAGS